MSKFKEQIRKAAEFHADYVQSTRSYLSFDRNIVIKDFEAGAEKMLDIITDRCFQAEQIIKDNMGSSLDEVIEWRKNNGK